MCMPQSVKMVKIYENSLRNIDSGDRARWKMFGTAFLLRYFFRPTVPLDMKYKLKTKDLKKLDKYSFIFKYWDSNDVNSIY